MDKAHFKGWVFRRLRELDRLAKGETDEQEWADAAAIVQKAYRYALRLGLPQTAVACTVGQALPIPEARKRLSVALKELADVEAVLCKAPKKLPQRFDQVYAQYQAAERKLGRGCTNKDAYKWFGEQRGQGEPELLPFDTWQTYLAKARKFYNTNKKTRGRVYAGTGRRRNGKRML
ncbi:MAG: hypothetical protein AB7O68_14870 [Pirellulales bacterium]